MSELSKKRTEDHDIVKSYEQKGRLIRKMVSRYCSITYVYKPRGEHNGSR